MIDPWEDIGHHYRPETYQEALASCIVLQPESEQESADRLAWAQEMARKHDTRFQSQFLTISEQQRISHTLAEKLGYTAMDEGME